MKLKLSTDLKNWNGTWDYELSELAPTVTMEISRCGVVKVVKLTQEQGNQFHNGQSVETVTTENERLIIKGFFKLK